jgi:tRNA (cmo5U34)-methyltransferase
MDDPIQRHPTRSEQLDILTSVIADTVASTDHARVLDIGCGTGYVAFQLAQKVSAIALTGVDLSASALASASENLRAQPLEFNPVAGDLMDPDSITLEPQSFDLAYTCLTFHDLGDVAKLAVIQWAYRALKPGGVLLIYDRLRLDRASLFPLQRSIWKRIEAHYGQAMRSADSFSEYVNDIGSDNAPARLVDYLGWYEDNGFDGTVLHLHGNIALLAGVKR